jgi:hypothetical protein
VNRGWWLGVLWLPAVAQAWEEEQALAFILAWHPVVTAQRAVATAYPPPTWTRRVMEHTSVFVRAASGTSSTVSESGDTTTRSPLGHSGQHPAVLPEGTARIHPTGLGRSDPD